jgi:isopentenyl-diphosphate delta-isomerase
MQARSVEERVVLVDLHDNAVGEMGKMEAHRKGVLHRAISVFVFNSEGEMLLQQRAESKYHCGGQWSNTACSHPRPGEVVAQAADRRLWEEMRLACDLAHRFSFVYRAEFDGGIVEHEFDHVFVGICDQEPTPNPDEVDNFRWANVGAVRREMTERSGKFTPWFRICFERAVSAPRINQTATTQE